MTTAIVVVVVGGTVVVVLVEVVLLVEVVGGADVVVDVEEASSRLLEQPTARRTTRIVAALRRANDPRAEGGVVMTFPACPLRARRVQSFVVVRGWQAWDVIELRPARTDDDGAIATIAAEGGSNDATPHYLAFVRERGRLLVAVDADAGGERVLGFGGMVPVGGVAMVTDLFVAATARTGGIGGQLLAALVDGFPHRMTCSSTHPAALAAYRRMGMEPRWRLRYLTGRALGGGLPMLQARWHHERPELVAYFVTEGAEVARDMVVHFQPRGVMILRLVGEQPEATMHRFLTSLRPGATVWCHVPEHHPLSPWLDRHDFWETQHDVFCATPGVDIDPALACLHPGLL